MWPDWMQRLQADLAWELAPKGVNYIRQPDGRWRVERNAGWGHLVTHHDNIVEAWLVGQCPV